MSITSRTRTSEAPPPVTGRDTAHRDTDRADLGGRTLNVFSHAFLLTWAVLVALPLVWTVLNAFKTDDEILSSAWSWPGSFSLDSFARAWTTANIGRYFLNTVIVVSLGVALTLVMASLVAYVIARYAFIGNRFIYFLFVAGMTFPVFLALVPLFFVADNLQMANTLPGLSVIYAAYSMPFAVFFLTAYFRTLPDSLAEAAFIDGCGHWGTFFRVMLPLARPGLLSVGIFVTIGQWNQFLFPLVMQTDPDNYVIAQGLAALAVTQGYASDWSGLFAGLTLSMIPVLVVYLVFQRQIQAGMVAGAIK